MTDDRSPSRLLFALRLARREGRAGFRRVGGFALAIALGVGALSGLDGFQRDAGHASRSEARSIMGGDLRLESQRPFSDEVVQVLDSLALEGARVGRVVSVATIVAGIDGSRGQLVQVQAVDSGFPVLPVDDPRQAQRWDEVHSGRGLVGDTAVFQQLGVAEGDSLDLGGRGHPVAGIVTGLPIDPGVQFVAGPPLWVQQGVMEERGLLGQGSVARYRAFVALPPRDLPEAVALNLRTRLTDRGLQIRTAAEEAESIAEGFLTLARFLGLVGLVALLLGGIGVGSAAHVYVRSRIPGIAVLRCLGASSATVFTAYLFQALALGLLGALLGLGLGLGIQFGLPLLLAGILPFEISPALHPRSLLLGLGLGTGVSFLFALLPLLRVREVPPLAALRLDVEGETGGSRGLRALVVGVLGAALLGLAILQTGGLGQGLALALACGLVLLILAGLGAGMARLARRVVPAGAPFPVRQGISGLFRPGNQTTAVVLSLGFGTFLVGAMVVAAHGLSESLRFATDGPQPSLFLFDVQSDQVDGVRAAMEEQGARVELAPVVASRLAGAPAADAPAWVRTRVFRNTWASELRSTETVVDGAWWPADDTEARAEDPAVRDAVEDGAARISIELDLAEDLGVGVGDRLDWDVQGREVHSVVASLRRVDWASFRPNFFVVFEPGTLDGAPATWIGAVTDEAGVGTPALERSLRAGHPNVSWVDVSRVRETVERIATRVLQVLAALTAFVVAGGVLVLLAALLSGRYYRRREAALLRTLGARAGAIRSVFVVEYAALGLLAGAAGLLLGAGGGLALLHWGFELGMGVPWLHLAAVWLGTAALVIVAGWATAGPVLRDAPVVVLREAEQ